MKNENEEHFSVQGFPVRMAIRKRNTYMQILLSQSLDRKTIMHTIPRIPNEKHILKH